VRNADKGKVIAVSLSKKRGVKKTAVPEALFEKGRGIAGDAHAGRDHREVSLLASESIEKIRSRGLDVGPGDFAENITTENFDLASLKTGDRIKLGCGVILEISQIGKVCHSRCEIYYQAGDCVMPKEGVFARVLAGGMVREGDGIIKEEVPLCTK